MARSNARLEVSGAGKIEDGLVQYNEEVNKLGDDLRELYETIRVNVDEEEQWKVFDFVEDFFMEELEIGDYINDIKEIWKINDIVQAKIPRGYDEIEKN